MLLHGTWADVLPLIEQQGLRRMSRCAMYFGRTHGAFASMPGKGRSIFNAVCVALIRDVKSSGIQLFNARGVILAVPPSAPISFSSARLGLFLTAGGVLKLWKFSGGYEVTDFEVSELKARGTVQVGTEDSKGSSWVVSEEEKASNGGYDVRVKATSGPARGSFTLELLPEKVIAEESEDPVSQPCIVEGRLKANRASLSSNMYGALRDVQDSSLQSDDAPVVTKQLVGMGGTLRDFLEREITCRMLVMPEPDNIEQLIEESISISPFYASMTAQKLRVILGLGPFNDKTVEELREMSRALMRNAVREIFSDMGKVRNHVAKSPYGKNATGRVKTLDQLGRLFGEPEMCGPEGAEVSLGRNIVASFNPVFCQRGVEQTVQDAVECPLAVIVAPVRYMYSLRVLSFRRR